MVRLTTQPEAKDVASTSSLPRVVTLRSGFYAVPFSLSSSVQLHLFLRSHKSTNDDGDDGGENDVGGIGDQEESVQLFVTGLPYGSTMKSIKANLIKLFPTNQISNVEMLPSTSAIASASLLHAHELRSSMLPSNALVSPLFSDSPALPSTSSSAIATFTLPPSLPPSLPTATYLTWSTPTLPSYLSTSTTQYALARPHRSTVIAHSDSWMTAFDARALRSTADGLANGMNAHEIPLPKEKAKKEKLKRDKSGKIIRAAEAPLPGSAAHALLVHTSILKRNADRTIDPDQVVEEDWTFVSRGGKHGKSILPQGAKVGMQGYGGAVVGVAKAKKLGEETEEVGGLKVIVGEGFYRFRKDEKRRDELTEMRSKFEGDKLKISEFRQRSSFDSSSRGDRGGRGRGGSRGRGVSSGDRGGRGGGGGGTTSSSGGGRGRGRGSSGKDSRSFKPY